MLGRLTEKTDVFSFGVVDLETISGRLNADLYLGDDKIYLLEWVCNRIYIVSFFYLNWLQSLYYRL